MASNDHTTQAPTTVVKPSEVHEPPAEQYEGSSTKGAVMIDVLLRVFLFATALVAVVVMVTSKQTKVFPFGPGIELTIVAKFNQSPAFIYFVAALSVACFYSIISGALSVFALLKPRGGASSTMLQFQFLILDALLLGIVAAATGAAGGVGYIGFKGNTHAGWTKVCDLYGSFCHHFAASIIISLVSSITLLLLVWVSVYALSKKITRP